MKTWTSVVAMSAVLLAMPFAQAEEQHVHRAMKALESAKQHLQRDGGEDHQKAIELISQAEAEVRQRGPLAERLERLRKDQQQQR